jgi:lysophosphatidate acyltransferase
MPSLLVSSFLIWITLYAYKKSPKFKCAIKTILYFLGLGIASVTGISLSPLFYLLGAGRHCNFFVGKITQALIPILTGIKVEVKGRENLNIDRPVVFIANHQARLDLAVLAETITPGTLVMVKQSLKYYPILGQYLMIAKNVFISRSNSQSAVDTMKKVVKSLVEDKTSLYMYPEGTRSHQKTGTMLPFKKGAFHLAVQGQMPIVPIVISTYSPYYSEENLIWDDLLIQVQGNFKVLIIVLPPIETVGLTADNVDDLTNSTRKLMIETLSTISTKPLGNTAVVKNE